MNTTTTKEKTANERLTEINAQIIERLQEIGMNVYNNGIHINWGHVGSSAHVLEELDEIAAFLGKRS
jgi:hypothetical protein